MIPTYNCAHYLRETLASVLAQDLGPEKMQIEVVDDCSTLDNPAAVVKELGRGRVEFYRQPKNQGYIRSKHACSDHVGT
jgi:glycosyltransferase involved in cell wall biosynthesis